MSIDLGVVNRTVLKKAVEALGWFLSDDGTRVGIPKVGSFSLNKEGIASAEQRLLPQVNALRLQCAKEAVWMQSKKLGWKPVNVGPNKLRLTKGV